MSQFDGLFPLHFLFVLRPRANWSGQWRIISYRDIHERLLFNIMLKNMFHDLSYCIICVNTFMGQTASYFKYNSYICIIHPYPDLTLL